jgi:tungstate transport system permease protein
VSSRSAEARILPHVFHGACKRGEKKAYLDRKCTISPRVRNQVQDFGAAFGEAFALITAVDPDFIEIVLLSLRVTMSAVVISCVIGMPLGALLAVARFPGRGALAVFINAMMGLPPVVVGLGVYLMLSRAGPFGVLGLLYTPAAMIVAQTILVIPIVASLTRQVVEDLHTEYDELLRSMGVSRMGTVGTLLWDARYSLVTAALAGTGRALAEVGAVMIVGGNIDHVTRVMTTAIALETAKGELALALGLGIVLVSISVLITAGLMGLRRTSERMSYA